MYYDQKALSFLNEVTEALQKIDIVFPYDENAVADSIGTDMNIGEVTIYRGRERIGKVEFDDFSWVFTPEPEEVTTNDDVEVHDWYAYKESTKNFYCYCGYVGFEGPFKEHVRISNGTDQ